MVNVDKVYIDTDLLVGWFLSKFYPKKHKEPLIVKFLSEYRNKIKSYISMISIAEIMGLLIHDSKFKDLKLKSDFIEKLISELQTIIGFNVIFSKARVFEQEIICLQITDKVIEYIAVHPHLVDCIHLDIAKSNDLFFVSHEDKIGKLKDLYPKIMTDKKLEKQFTT
jgi:hypothetical protein